MQKPNNKTNASIVGAPGMMYNEATTFNNRRVKNNISPPPYTIIKSKHVHKKHK